MTTLTAQAEITADHRLTMDVPVSADLPIGRLEVTVALTAPTAGLVSNNRKAVAILVEIAAGAQQRDAVTFLEQIAARGGVDIPDPVAWQRVVREDRLLPGRD